MSIASILTNDGRMPFWIKTTTCRSVQILKKGKYLTAWVFRLCLLPLLNLGNSTRWLALTC